ncbi:MAG: ATP-binding cassette domain-containing protein, partial [Candidatus Wallbacteria bacterium]|nr:ATP-binding cassette domain-containing protein [Candidatus Wallbacteria bacterium]
MASLFLAGTSSDTPGGSVGNKKSSSSGNGAEAAQSSGSGAQDAEERVLAIETVDLVKEYWDREASFFMKRKKRVVDNVNLQIRQGEVYGFLGKNGAGKTTTIKMILGLTFPTSGAIRVFGRSGDNPETRAIIGFAPEKPSFYPHLRAGELKPHDQRHLITRLAPADYDPQATCPNWIEFL